MTGVRTDGVEPESSIMYGAGQGMLGTFNAILRLRNFYRCFSGKKIKGIKNWPLLLEEIWKLVFIFLKQCCLWTLRKNIITWISQKVYIVVLHCGLIDMCDKRMFKYHIAVIIYNAVTVYSSSSHEVPLQYPYSTLEVPL